MSKNLEKSKNRNFQIAILIEDIADAKSLSEGLREIGIFAHYYQDLDELWVSLNTYTPDFCIVDVKKMSQGTLLFKHHPKVKNNSLKYAFYYKDSTKILLQSTYGLNHYGYVRAELNLVDQLRSVLRRRNEELRLQELNESMTARVDRLRLRGKRLAELQEKSAFMQQQEESLADVVRSFGVVDSIDDYKRRLVTIFDQWDKCLEFGVYELNMTGQKLMAPKFNKAKYRILPDLWLAQKSEGGINSFAQDMAYDVAYGLMDEGVTCLKIEGAGIDPDLLVLAQFEESSVRGFNFEMLELKLSSEYRRAVLRSQSQPLQASHQESQFELMQTMDDISFNQAGSIYRYALVDFSSLVNFIKLRPTNRFFWKTFAKDFMTETADILNGKYKVTSFGAGHFVIAIEKRFVESDFMNLKSYLEGFEYWRYFEDSSLIVTSDVRPSISFMAPSSVNLIRQVEGEDMDSILIPSSIRESGRTLEV